jgi:hypothetical protein
MAEFELAPVKCIFGGTAMKAEPTENVIRVRMRLKSATYKKPKMDASLVRRLECNNVTLRREPLDGIFADHSRLRLDLQFSSPSIQNESDSARACGLFAFPNRFPVADYPSGMCLSSNGASTGLGYQTDRMDDGH